jgi:hypothetical protein
MTKSITATLPDETVEWLRRNYPDATSDSARIAMAISDARLVRGGQAYIGTAETVESADADADE